MKIFFLYHIAEREIPIIELIERRIKQISPRVEIAKADFYLGQEEVYRFNPDVIVSIPPRDYNSSCYLLLLKAITKAGIVSMETEGYFNINDPDIAQFRIGNNIYPDKLVDSYIVFGERTKEVLSELYLRSEKVTSPSRVYSAGYGLYQPDVQEILKNRNIDKYNEIINWIEPYKKKCLVLTGFELAEYSPRDMLTMNYILNNDDESVKWANDQINAFRAFREKYIDDVIRLSQEEKDMCFVVKVHPAEISNRVRYYDRLIKYSNILLIKESFPLGLIMPFVDCMVHYGSTCALEAYIYNCPTIMRYEDNSSVFLDRYSSCKDQSTYSCEISDVQGFMSVVRNVKFEKNERCEEILYGLFNWKRGVEYNPIDKIANIIIDTQNRVQKISTKDIKKTDIFNTPYYIIVRHFLFISFCVKRKWWRPLIQLFRLEVLKLKVTIL